MATIAKVCGIGCYSYAAYKVMKDQLLGLPNLDGKEKVERGDLKDFTEQTARAMGITKNVELYRSPPTNPNAQNLDLKALSFTPSFFGARFFPGKMGVVIPSQGIGNRNLTPNEAKYYIAKHLTHIRRNDVIFTHIIPLIVAIAVTILIFPAYPILALVAGLAVKTIGTLVMTKWRYRQTEIATLDHCPPEVKIAALGMFEGARNIVINARERLDTFQHQQVAGQRPHPAWLKMVMGGARSLLNWGQPAVEDSIAHVRQSLN